MGIDNVDRTLPSNRLVFDVRRDLALVQRFRDDLEGLMQEYGLSEEEKQAFRSRDFKRLGELGVHPYFLPQTSRLYTTSADNHNDSEAAQLYARNMLRNTR
jgi:hypothetical protein